MAETSFVYGLPSEVVTPIWTLTSADPDFPATNAGLFDDANLAFPALSTATGDDLVGDFGAATRVDWLLIQHNLDPNLSVVVNRHASNSWASPTVTGTYTTPTKRTNGYTDKLYVDLTILSGNANLRWIRIHLASGSPANSVPIGFKVLCCGQKHTFDRDLKMGYRFQRPQRGIEHTTDGGLAWHYTRPSGARVLVATLEPTNDNCENLIDWFEDADGGVTAMADLAGRPGEAYLVRLRSSGASGLLAGSGPIVTTLDPTLAPYGTGVDFNTVQITAEEVSSGLPEWT